MGRTLAVLTALLTFTFLLYLGEGIGGNSGLAIIALLLLAAVAGLIRRAWVGPHPGMIWYALLIVIGTALARAAEVNELVFWQAVTAYAVIFAVIFTSGLLFYRRFLERYGGPVFPDR